MDKESLHISWLPPRKIQHASFCTTPSWLLWTWSLPSTQSRKAHAAQGRMHLHSWAPGEAITPNTKLKILFKAFTCRELLGQRSSMLSFKFFPHRNWGSGICDTLVYTESQRTFLNSCKLCPLYYWNWSSVSQGKQSQQLTEFCSYKGQEQFKSKRLIFYKEWHFCLNTEYQIYQMLWKMSK